jgi:hypothetical protein
MISSHKTVVSPFSLAYYLDPVIFGYPFCDIQPIDFDRALQQVNPVFIHAIDEVF